MSQETPQPVHWKRGGSKSDRIVACPGCVNEAEKWPAEPSGAPTIDGTHSHTLLEHCLNEGHKKAEVYVNKTLTDHEGSFVVELDRAKRVNVALDYIYGRMAELSNPVLVAEQFVNAGQTYMIPEWGGSADVTIYHDEGVETIDYKDGGKPVSADTYQTDTYAIGSMNAHPDRFYKTIRNTIIQPKVKNEAQFVEYTYEQFQEKIKPLISAEAESCKPDAVKVAGDHCKWCPGAKPGRCEVFNTQATGAVNDAFAMTTTGVTPLPANAPFQLPEIDGALTNEKLATVIEVESVVIEWFKEARKEALRRAMAGQVVPNHKVIRGGTKRAWVPDALETLNKMRLKKHVYIKEALTTPKQVLESEAVKGLSDKQRAKIEALVTKPEGALKLVPESERGAPVSFGLSNDAIDAARTIDVPQIQQPPTNTGDTASKPNTFVTF